MANKNKQQEALNSKLKLLDTLLVVFLVILCLITFPLAIITLVQDISIVVNVISVIALVSDVVLIIVLIADVLLGTSPITIVKNIIEDSESVDEMTGVQFENFVADRLRAAGWEDVEITPASGDHGVDVLGSYDGVRYAFQCKRYKGSVDTKAVQEVYTGRGVYEADRAVVITNSTFTRQAKEMAEKLGVELWNVENLPEMITGASTEQEDR